MKVATSVKIPQVIWPMMPMARLRDFVIRGLAIGIIGQLTCGIFSLVATCMIFSTYHETLWDKWAGTLVVDDREGRTLA